MTFPSRHTDEGQYPNNQFNLATTVYLSLAKALDFHRHILWSFLFTVICQRDSYLFVFVELLTITVETLFSEY